MVSSSPLSFAMAIEKTDAMTIEDRWWVSYS